MQGSRKEDRKIDITVLARQLGTGGDKVALLPEPKPLRKQTWWQNFSQSLNLAGVWLFWRVLFVSQSIPIGPLQYAALHVNDMPHMLIRNPKALLLMLK